MLHPGGDHSLHSKDIITLSLSLRKSDKGVIDVSIVEERFFDVFKHIHVMSWYPTNISAKIGPNGEPMAMPSVC